MNFFNISTVARYVSKSVRRTWMFRVFAILSLVGIPIFQILIQGNVIEWTFLNMVALSSWNMIALSSYVPYFNVYLFGIVQAVAVGVVGGSLLDKYQNVDTNMCVRSLKNEEYVMGNVLGIILVFMGLSFCSLLLGAILNLFLTDAPFNGWIYFYYWIVFLFPSLVFILSLTILGSKFVSLFVSDLLLVIFFTLYYLNDSQYGIFNFLGFTIPNTFSDITGFPNFGGVLLQRLIWLFLGMGLIGYSIVVFKRPCEGRKRRVISVGVSTLLMVIGIACGLVLFLRQSKHVSLRKSYRATYEKYNSIQKLTLNDQDMTYRQHGDQLKVNTHLRLKNEHAKKVTPVILYLNPGLRVDRIAKKGDNIDFYRENQVIIINDTVIEEGILELDIEYSGEIDESICYLQLPDVYVTDTWNNGSELFRSGKRYAFLEKDYTLLTPECIWYPVSVSPVNLSNSYAIETNFTNYNLKVIGEKGRTVLSQGERIESGDTLIFKNEYGLPGISLCVGDYKSYKIQVDSVLFELYLVDGHDDFIKFFSHVEDYIPAVIHEFKKKIEEKENRRYPYGRFMLVETPVSFAAYFRNERGGSQRVQPEMFFLPERGVGFRSMNLGMSMRIYQKMMDSLDIEAAERAVLNQLLDNIFTSEYGSFMEANPLKKLFVTYSWANFTLSANPFSLSPLFYNYVTHLYCSEYPVMDMVLNTVLSEQGNVRINRLNDISTRSRSYKKAVTYLKNHSLKEALKDPLMTSDVLYQLIKLKSIDLKERYFGLTIPSADFDEFISRYWEKYKFQKIDFSSFNNEFMEEFGMNWFVVLPEWYTIKRIPSFLIQDAYIEEIGNAKEDYYSGVGHYRIHVRVYNESDVDGVVVLSYTKALGAESNSAFYKKNVLIGAKKAKEIVVVTEGRPSSVFLNTVVSENMPMVIPIEETEEATLEADPGIRDVDISHFLPKEGELIVDNESDDFSIWQKPVENTISQWIKPNYSVIEYNTFNIMMASDEWTLVTHYGFYGGRIRSGWMKKCGDGESKTKWSVKIKKAGYYNVFAYIPKYVGLRQAKVFEGGTLAIERSPSREMKQNYTVQHDGKETDVLVEVVGLKSWVCLGRFYFSPGEASVMLTDKGSVEDQIIYADAVKWVLDEKNELFEK